MSLPIFRLCPAILVVAVLSAYTGAEQFATTEDGRKVVLKEDGTWRYATRSDLVARKMTPGSAGGAAKQDPLGFPSQAPRTVSKQPRKQGSSPAKPGLSSVITTSSGTDFRSVSWGAGKAQVKKSESAQLVKETDATLEYAHTLAGMNCSIVYRFHNGALNGGTYVIKQDHVDPGLFYKDFERLSEHMTQVYGAPWRKENKWKDDMYKSDKSKWGFAISIGFLSCHVSWRNRRTGIELSITGQKHRFNTTVKYSML